MFFLYLFFTIAIFLFEKLRTKYSGNIDILSFINAFIFLEYLMPGIAFGLKPDFYHSFQMYQRIPVTLLKDNQLSCFFLILVGYLSILVGYFTINSILREKNFNIYIHKSSINIPIFLALISIPLGYFSIYAYSLIYDGYFMAIVQANAARAGYDGVYNPYKFLKRFMNITTLPFLLLIAVYKDYKNSIKIIVLILLIILFVISIIGLLINAGRGNFIYLFGLIFIIYSRGYLSIRSLTAAGALAVCIILFGNSIFNAFQISDYQDRDINEVFVQDIEESTNNVIFKGITEFAHPLLSLSFAINQVNSPSDFRYFSDVQSGIFSLLPSQLLGLKEAEDISFLNTYYFLDKKHISVVPPGLFAYAYHTGGAIGFTITTFIFGFFSGLIHILLKSKRNPVWVKGIYFYLALSIGFFIHNGVPKVWFHAHFTLIIWSIIIFLFYSTIGYRFFLKKYSIIS